MTDSFQQLLKDIKNCQFNSCPRNPRSKMGMSILFPRTDESLSKVKILVVSEEYPGTEDVVSIKKIEDALVEEVKNGKGVVPRAICNILGKTFDVLEDEIYWTHSLKCIPTKNHENNQASFKYCKDYLKREIALLPNLKKIMAFGDFAFSCLVEISTSANRTDFPEKLGDVIMSTSNGGCLLIFDSKKTEVYPFYHPSYAYVYENRYIKEKKRKFIFEIRKHLLI